MSASSMPAADCVVTGLPDGRLKPALRWDVRVLLHEHENVATLLRGDFEYRFAGISAEALRQVVLKLDGRREAADIAQELGLEANLVAAAIKELVRNDLAIGVEATQQFVTGEEFCAIARRLFPYWKERLFGHQLWQDLTSGRAMRAQFVGWLIESYHFIDGVNERLSMAVAECADQRARSVFAKHYTEEYDHARFFVDALDALGIGETTVRMARPLPGTRAVLTLMRQFARRDYLQYAVCSGFLESTGGDRERARTFFELLAEHYTPDLPGVMAPLVAHVNLDEAYRHNDLMEKVVPHRGVIDLPRADRAIEAGLLLVETLEMWSTDILRHYASPDFVARCGLEPYRLKAYTTTNKSISSAAADPEYAADIQGYSWKTDGPLADTARPLLNPYVDYHSAASELQLESGNDIYTFSGQSSNLLKCVLPFLDGTWSVSDLASYSGASTNSLRELLGVLIADDLLLDVSRALVTQSPDDFFRAYLKECRFWSKQIFEQPFWSTLQSGAAPSVLVLGWGIEFLHYVEAANEHMAASVAHCRDRYPTRTWLADHYAEEFNHSEIFLEGLTKCGLDPDQVRSALPLASTRSLINYLYELAASDTLSYVATFGVMQAEGERTTSDGISAFCDRLTGLYPFAEGLFVAVKKHALIDVELAHQDLLIQRLCSRLGSIPADVARRILAAARETAEHFILFFEGINDYYSAPGAPLPRRGIDVRTLV
ncbi:MAG: iron-containing redox enzyme family protein [Acidobacteriota bacterium]